MPFDLPLLWIYRALAVAVAAGVVVTLFRSRDWREQVFAALVFVPFVLRGIGVK
jgi:hypothetical protein